jgi:hypothetical protein
MDPVLAADMPECQFTGESILVMEAFINQFFHYKKNLSLRCNQDASIS